MLALARIFGWKVENASEISGPTCWLLKKALKRARDAEAVQS